MTEAERTPVSPTVAALEQLAKAAIERVKATEEFVAARDQLREVEGRFSRLESDVETARGREGIYP